MKEKKTQSAQKRKYEKPRIRAIMGNPVSNLVFAQFITGLVRGLSDPVDIPCITRRRRTMR